MSSLYHVKGEIVTHFEDDEPIKFETQTETFSDLIEHLIGLGMRIQNASSKRLIANKVNVTEIYVNHRW